MKDVLSSLDMVARGYPSPSPHAEQDVLDMELAECVLGFWQLTPYGELIWNAVTFETVFEGGQAWLARQACRALTV